MSRKPEDAPYGGNDLDCPKCEETFIADSIWDCGDTCPWCQAEVEWEVGGDTDSGFGFEAVREEIP